MKKLKFLWYVLFVAPIILIILGYIFPSSFFSNQEQVQTYVQSFGVWSPVAFIIIQVLQVVLTPINHYAIGLVGGFVFGTWYGFALNWIGRVIGTTIAFYLGKTYGRKILTHVVNEKTITKYDKIFDKGKIVLFLMYFLPLFPDDELSYLAGMSTMKAKIFLPLMALGHIGGSLGLAYIGSGIESKDPVFIGISLATIIAGIAFVILYRKMQREP